jgi:hypothetical protein
MKNILVVVLSFVLAVSCNGKKSFSDEEYKQKQVDYEKKKAELSKSNGEFYKENKQKLMDFAELLKSLKDTTKSFKALSKDTSYFKSDVLMKSINFQLISNPNLGNNSNTDIPEVNVFFLHRKNKDLSKEFFNDPFKELITCYESKNDFACLKMKQDELQKILDLKYAFIVDDLIKVKPEVTNSSEFQSGLYIGSIECYDLSNKTTIYSFAVAAQNSAKVSSMEGGLEMEIKLDFDLNIRKAIEDECKKHFLFSQE